MFIHRLDWKTFGHCVGAAIGGGSCNGALRCLRKRRAPPRIRSSAVLYYWVFARSGGALLRFSALDPPLRALLSRSPISFHTTTLKLEEGWRQFLAQRPSLSYVLHGLLKLSDFKSIWLKMLPLLQIFRLLLFWFFIWLYAFPKEGSGYTIRDFASRPGTE